MLRSTARNLPIVLLFSIFSFLFSATPVVAQTNVNHYAAPNTNPDVPKNLHMYTQNVVIEVLAAAACQISGVDVVNPQQQCLGIDQTTGKIGFVQGGGGLIGLMGNMIAMTYTPALGTSDYFKYLANNFGVAKTAYAQGSPGVGFKGLNPLTNVWSAFRNITYLLLVIVFVIVGFAIMLRVKIDPRTVMTIENQIPKIIAAILLITFSFAIAGFLIDLMWVAIYLVTNIFAQADPKLTETINDLPRAQNPFVAFGNIGGFKTVVNEPSASIGGLVSQFFATGPGRVIAAILTGLIGTVTGGGIQKLFTEVLKAIPLVGGIFGALAGIAIGAILSDQIAGSLGILIAYIIIGTAVMWALFRLWIALVMAYVNILIDTVLAPFWILAGLIPGSPVSFGAWLRHILANLLAFPATIGMFLLGVVFIHVFGTGTQNQFVPPLIGNTGSTHAIGALIGLGIIFLTPQVVAMLKDALKSPDLKYTAAIGQAAGIGPSLVGSAWHSFLNPYGALATFQRIARGQPTHTFLDTLAEVYRKRSKPQEAVEAGTRTSVAGPPEQASGRG